MGRRARRGARGWGVKAKPITPYQRLLDTAAEWARKVTWRKERGMWTYPKAQLGEHWSMSDLYQRTLAAQQLGYHVILVADEKGLMVRYREDVPQAPYEFRS